MRLIACIIALLVNTSLLLSQEVANLQVEDSTFQSTLEGLLHIGAPAITVQELHENQDEYIILDTREIKEYEVSRIPTAKHFGYTRMNNKLLKDIPKDQKIAVYCSIGYRSERVCYQLRKRGYTEVYNVYGSIFEWANQDYPLEKPDGSATQEVHTYSSKWAQYLVNPAYKKVW